ncbi:nickel/cobalt transporter [Limoniibacter endophyticus]|uniref:Nickel/cobalt efflux system n=1 Tax=Limoniibacter endophyticus TaxID=1565040 RepID=A0A8J3GH50_9HYPH|nr:nickel/cobalt transporter [Limoniibacter endophyticus]GHC64383.1 nickel/cobalt efflux system [Limoniibacter endophyticus]
MKTAAIRCFLVLIAVAMMLPAIAHMAHAQSSLGIGSNEATLPSTGWFAPLLNWINTQQQSFYGMLRQTLSAMRQDNSALLPLIGLSFVYGIFHAAGPGHGKAVISSYMLANEIALRRGILLSVISAILQGLTAVLLVGAAFLFLRKLSIGMTQATWAVEVCSYAMVTLFGAWLLYKKITPLVRHWLLTREVRRPAPHSLSAAVAFQPATQLRACANTPRSANSFVCDAPTSEASEICTTCGVAHAIDPARFASEKMDWRAAGSALLAVGLRPCSGALIVLTFSFMNGLWLGGLLSVLAMSLGTAITVAALAMMAVGVKGFALSRASNPHISTAIHHTIEIGGAAFVLIIGLLLLSASLSA